MAVGNTFCATAISSYAGFWIALAITFTPGGFAIISTIESAQGPSAFYDSFAFFLFVCEPPSSSFLLEIHPRFCFCSSLLTQNANPGLVYIHNCYRLCHAPLECSFILRLLYPGSCIPIARDWILAPGCPG